MPAYRPSPAEGLTRDAGAGPDTAKTRVRGAVGENRRMTAALLDPVVTSVAPSAAAAPKIGFVSLGCPNDRA